MNISLEKVIRGTMQISATDTDLQIEAEVTLDEQRRIISANGTLKDLEGIQLAYFHLPDQSRLTIEILNSKADFNPFESIKKFVSGVEEKASLSQNLINF